MISGPNLPEKLSGHSMIAIEFGQAIIGGYNDEEYFKKIYHLGCASREFVISKIKLELSIPRGLFVAIPIPDFLSGCVLESKALFMKTL